MANRDILDGFFFNTYLSDYIKRKGISKSKIGEILELNYSTVKSKFRIDSFTYREIHFLDMYYLDLRYFENRNNYIKIRLQQRGRSIESIRN